MPYSFTTSGSTGVPKTFSLTDEELAARAAARRAAKGDAFASITRLFCDLSLRTTSGLTYRIWAAQAGIGFFTPAGGNIEAALALFEAEAIDGIVGNSLGLLNYALANAARPHRFACVLGSGTPTSAAQSRAIRAGLGDAAYYGYGCSEVGSIAIATAAQVESIPGCAGALCPGVQVEFDGELIRVKTATMIQGYDDPALTAQYFKDGWFYPGDRGRLTDGLLVLAGRA